MHVAAGGSRYTDSEVRDRTHRSCRRTLWRTSVPPRGMNTMDVVSYLLLYLREYPRCPLRHRFRTSKT